MNGWVIHTSSRSRQPTPFLNGTELYISAESSTKLSTDLVTFYRRLPDFHARVLRPQEPVVQSMSKSTQPLILASASPIRSELLRRNRVPHEIKPARVDEPAMLAAMLAEDATPRDIVDALAELKAHKISQANPTRIVLGADQVLVHEGQIFSKATTLDDVREQLHRLQGNTHQLLSAAVAFENGKPVWRHIGKAELTMRPLTQREIEAYIYRHDDALYATVGCYRIEEDGPSLFSQINGDYFSIQGLPLLQVLQFLRTRGVSGE